MASDDQPNDQELERKQLLEEIKKRAEEAELKRIEEEEKKAGGVSETAAPTGHPPPVPAIHPRDQRIFDLRDGLLAALDRGNIDRASGLYEELKALSPQDPTLDRAHLRILALREERQTVPEKQAPPKPKEAPPEPKEAPPEPKEEPPPVPVRPELLKKKIPELLERANSHYQQERYQKALETTNEVLAIDKENEDALTLREQIVRAKQLAEQIKAEETKRKAEEAAVVSQPVDVPSAPKEKADVWGSTTVSQGDVGYELAPEQAEPVAAPRRPLIERVVVRAARIRLPVKPILIGAGALAFAGIVYYIVERIGSAVFPPKYSILVFPATNTPPDSVNDYFTDGLTEDLINELSVISDLRTISSHTVFAYKYSTLKRSQIARGVGANYFLEWSVLRNPDAVALRVTLFDTLSPSPVVVTHYQNSLRELPALPMELARMLSGAMQIELSSVEADALRRIPTTVPTAYEAYLRGRWYVRHSLEYTLDSAIDAFDRAVQEDPNFGEAHASLAWAYVLLMESDARTPRAVIDRAALHVQRALALGARNSEAFRAWALIEQYRGLYEKSVQRLEEAVETAPSDAEAQRRLSVVYSVRGNTDGAVKAARKAVADDPRNLASHTTLGMVFQFKAIIDGSRGDEPEGKRSLRAALKSYEDGLLLARDRSEYASAQYVDVLVYLQRPDRAAEILNDRVARTRESYVDYYKLARIYQTAGRAKQEWEGLLRRAKDILLARLGTDPDDGMGLSYLALVHTRLGEFKEATAASRRAEKVDPGAPEVLYNIARMYALQRDKVQALTYLSKAINLRYRLADVLDMDYFNLHSEPDFLSSITR